MSTPAATAAAAGTSPAVPAPQADLNARAQHTVLAKPAAEPHRFSLAGVTPLGVAPVPRRLVHPQGFRVLRDSSAIERSLRGYFRLPSAPSARLRAERERVQRTLLRIERNELRETARATGGAGGVVLDGFLLLSAAACEEPGVVESVTLQASHLIGAVAEDLPYFTSLRFLDVSENNLGLDELLGLPALETLHMACNRMRSLAGLRRAVEHQQRRTNQRRAAGTAAWDTRSLLADPEFDLDEAARETTTSLGRNHALNTSMMSATVHDVLLPTLVALNLSYNAIPVEHLPLLAFFPCLEKLDLSGNGLRRLPADLSCLASVTHLALESNDFTSVPTPALRGTTDGGGGATRDVFLSLSTMPSLVEVNLNYNRLSRVPLLSVEDGTGLCFPSVEVIGLSGNGFAEPADVAALAPLHRTLRRVVLSENPISRSPAKAAQTTLLFQQSIVDAYWERTRREAGQGSRGMCGTQGPDLSRGGGGADPDLTGDVRWAAQTWTRLIPQDGGADAGRAAAVAAAASAAEALASAGSEYSDATSSSTFSACTQGIGQTTEGHRAAHHASKERGDGGRRRSSSSSNNGGDSVSAQLHDEADAAAVDFEATHGTTTSLRDFFATAEDYLVAHDIHLVFQSATMPKRGTRYFYATQSRVAGQSTLVTIPEHKEFMDIYRITGRTRAHVAGQRRPPGKAATAPAAYRAPELEPTEADLPSIATDHWGEEPRLRGPRPGSGTCSEEQGFFMTEMVGSGGDSGGRGGSVKATTTPPLRANPASAPAGPVAAAAGSSRVTLPPIGYPVVDVPAPTGSVHAAVNELKALLRRPLLPLPYAQPSNRSVR